MMILSFILFPISFGFPGDSPVPLNKYGPTIYIIQYLNLMLYTCIRVGNIIDNNNVAGRDIFALSRRLLILISFPWPIFTKVFFESNPLLSFCLFI